MPKTKITAVCGATATGKSRLALEIARRYGGEIVSCDSMQIYRGMDIGTAKPTADERRRIPHHIIDILEPNAPFSVAEYGELAREAVDDILSREKLPIICGGTGLYLDAFMYENKYSTDGGNDPDAAAELDEFYEKYGIDALHERLGGLDPDAAAAIHKNNVRRVKRAILIAESTGITKTEWDKRSRGDVRDDTAVICLEFEDRELQRRAIAERCREMIRSGLVAETERLLSAGALSEGTTSYQAIGYKELIPYINGEESSEDAEARLTNATCRYAKRQATWYRKKDYVKRLYVDGLYEKTETFEEFFARAAEALGLENSDEIK